MVEVTNNPSTVSNRQESEALASHLARFRPYHPKRRKAHQSQTLARKFRTMDVQASEVHGRTKKAPSTEVVQTPITALLRMAPSIDGSMFRKRIPSNFPVSYPKSPPRQYKGPSKSKAAVSAAPLQGGCENPTNTTTYRATSSPPTTNRGRRFGSSASPTACHCPVRGHNPGLKESGGCLALIIYIFS